jgi:hypothetical protein
MPAHDLGQHELRRGPAATSKTEPSDMKEPVLKRFKCEILLSVSVRTKSVLSTVEDYGSILQG